MKNLRPYFLPLGLALLMTALALASSQLTPLLRFDRAALQAGEFWRLLTGHLVHLGWSHLTLNLAGLALAWGLVGTSLTIPAWLMVLVGSALGISLGLLVFNPELMWYVGLSGVLHTLLVAGALARLRGNGRAGRREGSVLLTLIWLKVGWEQLAGPLPGSEAGAGGTVIVDAHFYGALLGLLFGVLLSPRQTGHRQLI
jgi:rhomboid family GlyGly-CTERM serine protease